MHRAFTLKPCRECNPNYVFKPTAEDMLRSSEPLPRSGGLTTALGGMRLTVVLLLSLLASACGHQVDVIATSASPDGKHVASVYADMGGGAAGWCYICVDVVEGTAFDGSRARCSKEQQWFRCSATVSLVWQSSEMLVANYSGNPVTTPVVGVQPAASAPSVSVVYRRLP